MVRSFYALALGTLFSFFPYRHAVSPTPAFGGQRLAAGATAPSGFPLSNNPFAFNLLHAVLEQDPGSHNMLISPLSVYLTLSMLYNGAGHATRDAIAQTLQTTDIDIVRLNTLCKGLLQRMPAEDNKVQITFANSIWYNRKRLTLLPSFESLAENYYYAPVQPLNFKGPEAAMDINRWVARNTHKLIPAIAGTMQPDDLMYLVDAVCFNGDWKDTFVNKFNGTFNLPSGSEKLPFMGKTFPTRVFTDTSFTMVELPYGNGQAYSMYMILPDDPQESIREFAAAFNEKKLNYALDRMSVQSTLLEMPAWEYSYSIDDMQPALASLGMGIAFDKENADFSNMYEGGRKNACLSKTLHKAYIKVGSTGTKAAAATVFTLQTFGTVMQPHRIFRMIVDRPFLYVILEKQQNLLLFAGIVEDPAKN